MFPSHDLGCNRVDDLLELGNGMILAAVDSALHEDQQYYDDNAPEDYNVDTSIVYRSKNRNPRGRKRDDG